LLRSVPRSERGFWRTYLQPSRTADGKDRLVSLSLLAADFYRLRYHPDDLAAWPGRVLLLSATDDELYRSMHQPLRRLYPRAVEVTIPGGHAATISRDTAYLDAVESFLAGSLSADRA
jgi:pimeloyl-ACP methyl ester carboxylesterase